MSGLRIAAISFLNTAPLMWDFEHRDAAKDFQIEYTIPSACAAALAANQADIGIIPAFAYAEIPDLVILPKVAIASKDHVRSILLISKKPIEEIETVATDISSRTSVALTKVLLTRYFGGPRRFTPHAPQLDAMLRDHDAALIIGDAALQVRPTPDQYVYDLAHEWRRLTGKPFVFAFWAVRMDALSRAGDLDLTRIFQLSRDHGIETSSLATIAREWSPRLGLSEDQITSYLTVNIDYELGRENHAGLQLFLRYAHESGLLKSPPNLRFLGPVAFSGSGFSEVPQSKLPVKSRFSGIRHRILCRRPTLGLSIVLLMDDVLIDSSPRKFMPLIAAIAVKASFWHVLRKLGGPGLILLGLLTTLSSPCPAAWMP